MGRSPCCDKVGLKKGPWTNEEDQKLLAYIQEHGHGSWRALPPKAGLRRCGKSCRLRWTNYLRPDIKRGEFSLQEQQTIIQLHALLGNRWSAIASHLPKRTDNEIKNYWNTHLKKRLTKMGIDPMTHKPKSHGALGSGQGPKDVANLSHMAQWETARLEAEARIVRESKLLLVSNNNVPTYHLHHHVDAPPLPRPPAPHPPCLDILKVWQGTWLAKGKKDFSFNSGFYGSNLSHQLESPTSILNFSDNNMLLANMLNNNNNNSHNNVGLNIIHENTLLADVNYGQAFGGIMGNSAMQVHDVTDIPSSSSFLEGYDNNNVVGFMEDNYKINLWTNILNAVGSPNDSSSVF